MLAATIRAAGYVQLEVLIELGKPFFKVVDEPSQKTLGLSDGQFAELCAGAGYAATPEG